LRRQNRTVARLSGVPLGGVPAGFTLQLGDATGLGSGGLLKLVPADFQGDGLTGRAF